MGHGFGLYFLNGKSAIGGLGGYRGLDKIFGLVPCPLVSHVSKIARRGAPGGQECPSYLGIVVVSHVSKIARRGAPGTRREVQRSFVGSRSGAAPLPQDDNLICYQSNLAANSLGEQNGGLSLTGPQDPGLIYPRGAVP